MPTGPMLSPWAIFLSLLTDFKLVQIICPFHNNPLYKWTNLNKMTSAATLSIFRHLFASVAEEMGITLSRTAYSPNIKERLDFSCALFIIEDGRPQMLAQAAHIPVHLGAMPASVNAAVASCSPLREGDVVLLNDPFQGGNHLPDLTMVSPVVVRNSEFDVRNDGDSKYLVDKQEPLFFVASRAHHADVGGMSPGSMPLSTELYQEGIIIPPIKIATAAGRNEAAWQLILRNVRTPLEREGDLVAQLAGHKIGSQRLGEIVRRYGLAEVINYAGSLIDYAESLTRQAINQIPDGHYAFQDYMDDDGQSGEAVPIKAAISISGDQMTVDFAGTAPAVKGNINAVPAIAYSAVVYCLRCTALAILDLDLPMNEGVFRPLSIHLPPGSLLDPPPNKAVAAGNVETSQRIVDVVFGALAQALPDLIPAAGQGTMNNLTFGGSDKGRPFAYYETIGGGSGAGPQGNGCDGIHVHMSNTLNTPIEALEYAFPIRVEEYRLRKRSGGAGKFHGGNGLVRAIRFLTSARATITSERRRYPPYGLQGGSPGEVGQNDLIRKEETISLPGKTEISLDEGDIIRIATPGGGGWGK
jgi:N-methylhydantoinase B